ncbi:MAG: ferrochelatase [Steroidobacteraceae bacterium]|jgi:ferrochelatase|nr:ferrochelatase [Steroidobacteraceae bacterium]
MPYFVPLRGFSHEAPERVGILLVNIGTPDAPTFRAVRRYLSRFLSDRRVVDLPAAVWQPLLQGIILTTRPLRSARKYRKIWMDGGSPLRVHSDALRRELERQLAECGDRVLVELGMSYSEPGVASALEKLVRANCRRIVVVPMYPQYCSSTVGAVHDAVMRVLARWRWVPDVRFVPAYHDHPAYLAALARRTASTLRAAPPQSHLVMSFHGVPVRYVTDGDPYFCHCQKMARLLAQRLGLSEGQWSIAFQSRFGPAAWLQPYTLRVLDDLLARGTRDVVIVSPSFPVDCLETLEEIDIDYRRHFLDRGGASFRRVPALNDGADHAAALLEVINDMDAGWPADLGRPAANMGRAAPVQRRGA